MHPCRACGNEFATLAGRHSHLTACPARTHVDVSELAIDEIPHDLLAGLCRCDSCSTTKDTPDELDSELIGDQLALTVTIDCDCGAETTTHATIQA